MLYSTVLSSANRHIPIRTIGLDAYSFLILSILFQTIFNHLQPQPIEHCTEFFNAVADFADEDILVSSV